MTKQKAFQVARVHAQEEECTVYVIKSNLVDEYEISFLGTDDETFEVIGAVYPA